MLILIFLLVFLGKINIISFLIIVDFLVSFILIYNIIKALSIGAWVVVRFEVVLYSLIVILFLFVFKKTSCGKITI